jgi:hypothetical protein
MITLTGLVSNLEGEERALAHVEVNHDGNIYNWQVFLPKSVENIQSYLDSIEHSVIEDIDSKELAWSNLDPKTRTIKDPFAQQETVVEISKDEIVKPDIPDYYALRRNEYPSLGDQLDAVWKGVNSQDFINMQTKIAEVKAKYPKP